APTKRHRFHEGRVSAADLGGFHEAIRVAGQLAVSLAEEIAREDDPWIRRGAERADIVGSVGSIADNHATEVGGQLAKGLDGVVGTYVGIPPAQEQPVTGGYESMAREVLAGWHSYSLGSIGDIRRRRHPIPGNIVLLDPLGVGDNAVRKQRGPALGGADVPA